MTYAFDTVRTMESLPDHTGFKFIAVLQDGREVDAEIAETYFEHPKMPKRVVTSKAKLEDPLDRNNIVGWKYKKQK